MSQTLTISPQPPPRAGLLSRARQAIVKGSRAAARSFWSGPFNLKDPALNKFFGGGVMSDAGVLVTVDEAFTYSVVWDAVLQISSDIAKLPLVLYKRDGDSRRHYTEAKLYRLLHDEPNPDMSSMVFRRTIMAHALTVGNGYAEIERDRFGRPAGLWLLESPQTIRPVRSERTKLIEYDVRGTMMDARNVLHIQGLSFDGVEGYDVIERARRAIGLAIAAEKFASKFFANGTTFGGLLSTPENLDDREEREDLRKEIEQIHGGAEKAYRLLVLGGGFKFTRFGIDPNAAQMDETRQAAAISVANYFNMPPHKLKQLQATNNNIAEQLDLEYYKGCLLNWTTLWEQEGNRKLIAPLEYRRQYIKHTVDGFLRGDTKTRNEALALQRRHGIINADEWRALEEMNPIEGGHGQIYVIQGGFVPLDKVAALAQAQIDKKKAKPSPQNPTDPAGAPAPTDEEIDAANERARMADRLAAEATGAVDVLRDRLAALEADRSATVEALAAARAEVTSSTALAASMTARAELLATEHAALVTAHGDAQTRIASGQAAIVRAEAHVASVQARLEATEATAAQYVADLAIAEETALQARQEVSVIRATLEALSGEQRTLADQARADHAAAVEEARLALASAEQIARTAHAEVDGFRDAFTLAHAAVEAQAEGHAAALRELDALRLAHGTTTTALAVSDQAGQVVARSLEERERELSETRASRDAASERQIELVRGHQDAIERLAREVADAESRVAAAAADAATAVEAANRHAREATAALEARISAAEDEAATHRAEAARLTDAVTAAEANAASLTADRTAAQQALTAQGTTIDGLTGQVETLTRSVEAAQHETVTVHRAMADRVASQLAANRSVIADVWGRMARREAQQARTKQSTKDRLRRWLEGFTTDHEAFCLEAVLPAMRLHVAACGHGADPTDVARTLVREHIAAFSAVIARALETEITEEFQSELERLLTRWETDQPAAIADRLMIEEIAHVRG